MTKERGITQWFISSYPTSCTSNLRCRLLIHNKDPDKLAIWIGVVLCTTSLSPLGTIGRGDVIMLDLRTNLSLDNVTKSSKNSKIEGKTKKSAVFRFSVRRMSGGYWICSS